MSNVDPGGGNDGERPSHSDADQSTPDLSSLQENFTQQQVSSRANILSLLLFVLVSNVFTHRVLVSSSFCRQKYRP